MFQCLLSELMIEQKLIDLQSSTKPDYTVIDRQYRSHLCVEQFNFKSFQLSFKTLEVTCEDAFLVRFNHRFIKTCLVLFI